MMKKVNGDRLSGGPAWFNWLGGMGSRMRKNIRGQFSCCMSYSLAKSVVRRRKIHKIYEEIFRM